MKVTEVMTANPKYISPNTSIRKAAEKMKECDCGSVPVCDNGRLVGMLTDRDIVMRAMAEGKDPSHTLASDIMTHEVHYCFEDKNIDEVSQIMADKQIRRLIVLNENKKMTGIVSLGDIATKTGDNKLIADLTESVSEPN